MPVVEELDDGTFAVRERNVLTDVRADVWPQIFGDDIRTPEAQQAWIRNQRPTVRTNVAMDLAIHKDGNTIVGVRPFKMPKKEHLAILKSWGWID